MARRRKTPPDGDEHRERHKRVLEWLAELRLRLPEEELDAALARAERAGSGELALLDDVLGWIVRDRRERAAGKRIKQACFRQLHDLESFDWKFNPKAFNRRQIEELLTCDFVRRRDNLILIGQSGVGKSHIVQAIGQAACHKGYRVRYTTCADLIAELNSSLADGSLHTKLRRLQTLDLLVIDEFGFDRVERTDCPHAASLLYKAIDERHGRRSTTLVSNVDFAKWNDYMQDAPISMAFTDRLIDRATVLKITGRSFRAARRRTPESPTDD